MRDGAPRTIWQRLPVWPRVMGRLLIRSQAPTATRKHKTTPIPSDIVRAPRVAESPVSLECKLLQIVEISAQPMGGNIVIGEVVRFHVDDGIIDSSSYRIDAEKLQAVGRMSGFDYARTRDRFSLVRP